MTKEELEKEAEGLFDFPLNYNEIDIAKYSGFKKGYLAGAEPREKRIADLEKVCKDLSDKFDYQVKQVMKLEKENAELKRDKGDLIFIRNQNAKCMCEDKEQLTKAKELLEDFICYAHLDDCNLYIKEQAEQFLGEVEK